jgi:hypothetical protein
MFKRLLGLSLLFGMAATAPPAMAAPNCELRDTLVKQLSSKYSEQLAVGGLQKVQGTQALMEIWASAETGTFTVLVTNANGISCIVAAGTDYFEATPKAEPEGTAG